ncbi:hypothetical protein [Clostridium peptidivorans]|uniref:hypothetical protein n=1 Tax=Clostridium peptidivorans TaxID=100174 RepID=UPI000BE2ADA7|nr:hypothetical protein [Clostridium peptidivorans]
MTLNKKHSAIIEWIIAIVLVVICWNYSIFSYGSFSPIKAHEQSERTYHYGPSKIIKTIDLDGGKIYLCRYKDWFSANTVRRGIINWHPGDQVSGTPIDYSKQVSYSWSGARIKGDIMIIKTYGYVSDPKITTILFEDEGKTNTSRYALDESKMFIFYWNEDMQKSKEKYLKGLDRDGKVIYEEKLPGF